MFHQLRLMCCVAVFWGIAWVGTGVSHATTTSATATGVTTALTMKPVVIIGAGPAGLSTALMLEGLGYRDITVVEKRSYTSFESEKAYLYNLGPRGIRLTDMLGLTAAISARSISSFNFTSLHEILPTSEVRVKNLPIAKGLTEKYWLPRSVLLDILLKRIEEVNGQCKKISDRVAIKLLFSRECASIRTTKEGDIVVQLSSYPLSSSSSAVGAPEEKATVSNDDDELMLMPYLLIGSDGINSVVRGWLEQIHDDHNDDKKDVKDNNNNNNNNNNGDGVIRRDDDAATTAVSSKTFRLTKLPSDAAGLRFKMLTLKNRFPIPASSSSTTSSNVALPNTTDQVIGISKHVRTSPTMMMMMVPSTPETTYAIRSTGKTLTTRLSMGLLPVRGDTPRTANIICIPQHIVWTLKTAAEIKDFLRKSFPQLSLEDVVTDEELQRFASSSGGVFPSPQYCSDSYAPFYPTVVVANASSPYKNHEFDKKNEFTSAAILIGDAVHSFPPDLGQGVNSALDDVLSLHKFLQSPNESSNILSSSSSCSLHHRLTSFERERSIEAKALCELMSFGFPYQYNQAPKKAFFFNLNIALRIILNKVMPKLFSPPALYMTFHSVDMTYDQVLKAAHRTTTRVYILLSCLVALFLKGPTLYQLWTRLATKMIMRS